MMRGQAWGAIVAAGLLVGCSATGGPDSIATEHIDEDIGRTASQRPDRFTIVPDDYHVPYAGTAGDGRRFFLSDELFSFEAGDDEGISYIGLFLWHSDGTFDEVRVDPVPRPDHVPPGQAVPADDRELIEARLEELGDYVLEPIEVEPFITEVGGISFGWRVGQYDDGEYVISIEPGDFIAYYAPWDGLEYDT